MYVRAGIVTVLPWTLNITSQKEIRTEGLFAALNDCLYRTMYSFKYVLMIDLDEYIIPHIDSNYFQLISRINSVNNNDLRGGAYSFQNAFFYLLWPDDSNFTQSSMSSFDLSTLRKTRRKQKLHNHKQRSKLIVVPERVVEVGNHFVWEFVPRYQMVNIAPRVAFLHHYRICEYGGNECVKSSSVVDKRAHFWSHSLIETVEKMYKSYSQTCTI
ncbi:hypothetical protein B4U80_00416 [Leptotrombidium deliense]|uniref:Glycosyltransferase family 92 protein n=1 Tax=Leptotrombidium deliense TaxID=299467 RepID=A0A443SFH8_9ACAR|nr:hypothetical protein B4U80_00416 [Leptotrombidium deliense]